MSLAPPGDVFRRLRQDRARQGFADSALCERSARLLDTADELARTASEPADEAELTRSLACLGPALDALATATLQLCLAARDVAGERRDSGEQGLADGPTGIDAITSMLFGASQNLRIAAESSEQAHRSLLAQAHRVSTA